MEKINLKQIETFFNQKNIAFIGLSRNSKDFSRNVFTEFVKRNYNVIPVNPNSSEIEGRTCYPSVTDVPEPVDAAIVFVPSAVKSNIPKECLDKGIKNIWFYEIKPGQINPESEELKVNDANIISGYCPLMFISETQWFHKMHGFFVKLSGKYPV